MNFQTLKLDNILFGAVFGVVIAFPMASLCALVFRFPIPFSAYASGIDAAIDALLAVLFYGIIGGFYVVAILGAAAGGIADLIERRDPDRARRLTMILSASTTGVCILLLAVLDWIIGEW